MDLAPSMGALVIWLMRALMSWPRIGGAESCGWSASPGGLAFVPPGFGFGEPGLDLLVDVRVQGLPDGD